MQVGLLMAAGAAAKKSLPTRWSGAMAFLETGSGLVAVVEKKAVKSSIHADGCGGKGAGEPAAESDAEEAASQEASGVWGV